MEYNADRDYLEHYKDVSRILRELGWKEERQSHPSFAGHEKISSIFTKDGYAVYVLYGCEEDVKDEIL